jgi:hypothetical protein
MHGMRFPYKSVKETTMPVLAPAFTSSHPFHAERIHAVAMYCSDGRYGEQFDEFLHEALGLPRYDRMATPGGAACLAGHFVTYRQEDATLDQIRFLVESHHLERVVLIAHESCGYYLRLLNTRPADLRAKQEADLHRAAERLRGLHAGLQVDAFYARVEPSIHGNRVSFDPITP